MSDSPELDVVDAMIAGLTDLAWTTTTPVKYLNGPIPKGNLDFPCISVMSAEGESTDKMSLSEVEVRSAFFWELAEVLSIEGIDTQWRNHTLWRQEAVRYARSAIDNYWGFGGIVSASEVMSWTPSLVERPRGDGVAIPLLLSTSIRIEVSYREAY